MRGLLSEPPSQSLKRARELGASWGISWGHLGDFLGARLEAPSLQINLWVTWPPESNGAVIPRPAPPSRTMSQGTSTDPNGRIVFAFSFPFDGQKATWVLQKHGL